MLKIPTENQKTEKTMQWPTEQTMVNKILNRKWLFEQKHKPH